MVGMFGTSSPMFGKSIIKMIMKNFIALFFQEKTVVKFISAFSRNLFVPHFYSPNALFS
jgi:hypothetical protein